MRSLIGVVGSAKFDEKLCKDAEKIGKLIARKGCILVCGGLGGVMEASCKGAKSEGGTTIGIVPSKDKFTANSYVDICIPTGIGEARNFIIVNSSDVIIAIGGGFGTLSEISFALKSGVPVVGLNTWDVSDKIVNCDNPKQAFDSAFDLASGNYGNLMRHEKNL